MNPNELHYIASSVDALARQVAQDRGIPNVFFMQFVAQCQHAGYQIEETVALRQAIDAGTVILKRGWLIKHNDRIYTLAEYLVILRGGQHE